ncbi:MAG: GH3 auxin-responsive promoter family protein [Acetobacteraceae bacterium]|nr:GH3 auxin-responsive promoter family protein [Acetobacteraceae bacterium]
MSDATPLLRAYARWRRGRLRRQDPRGVQQETLSRLLRLATSTRFGRRHRFAAIRSIDDFQAAVPLRSYEDFWREFFQPAFPRLTAITWPGTIPYFALSSGTSSGTTKYIPVSRAMVRSNRRAALDVLVHHLANRPRSRVLAGKSFLLGGSTALRLEAHGVLSGDLSGIAAVTVPRWARPFTYPPPGLALLADWEQKIDLLASHAPAEPIRSLSGTPSWLLLFFERLATRFPDRPRRLAAYWPGLDLVVHGGVSFAPYRAAFAEWLACGQAELREVYPASEGFIAMADQGPDEGLRLIVDNGIFFEFVPVDTLSAAAPTRHWIANAETGVDYALALSSNAGLWSYLLGDIVRLVSRVPPRLRVVGRTSYFLSAFGEHLSGDEIEQAVLAAAAGAPVVEFAVGPETVGARGRHVFVVEFANAPPDSTRFADAVDAALLRLNEDYAAHRRGGQLLPPRLIILTPGCFAAWMAERGRLGGQNKVPRVITEPALLGSLLRRAGGLNS